MDLTTYQIVTLPRLSTIQNVDEASIALAKRYREYRLCSVKTDPSAFASNYETERQRGIEQSLERLANPRATYFVALKPRIPEVPASVGVESSLGSAVEDDWYGMIVLLGPQEELGEVSAEADPFSRMTATASRGANDPSEYLQETSHFHLNGMFVSPEARGAGLAKALVRHALATAEVESRATGSDLFCTLLVDEINAAAVGLYKKSGFVIVGKHVYVKTIQVDGVERTKERIALGMEIRKTSANALNPHHAPHVR